MMGFTLSCYLDLQEGRLPVAWHVNTPCCTGAHWEHLGKPTGKGRVGGFGVTSGDLDQALGRSCLFEIWGMV